MHAHGFSATAREKIEGGRHLPADRGVAAGAPDVPERVPGRRHSEEARVHRGDAGALPAGRVHPGAGHQRRRRRGHRRQLGQSNVLGFLNLFSGGSLQRFAIFALGIMPYITASIMLQLLTVVIPQLDKPQGGRGRPAEDHAVHALPHRRPRLRPVDRLRLPLPHLLERQRRGGRQLHLRARLRDRDDAHRRLRAADVARRADHPARHRQRHLADDLARSPPGSRTASRPGGRTRTRSSS